VYHKVLIAEQAWDGYFFSFELYEASDLAILSDNNLRAIAMT
jgi:hypothetical protein